MEPKEVYEKLAQRQLEGVMFHEAMAEYFSALECYERFFGEQREQADCEFNQYMVTKRIYRDRYGSLLVTRTDYRPDIIPAEWTSKLPYLSHDEKMEAIKKGMEKWLEWEKATLDTYHMLYRESVPHSKDTQYIWSLIKDVRYELSYIYDYLGSNV